MTDRVVFKGGNHVIENNTEGRIKLIQPARGTVNRFIRWWNRAGSQYIDCAIFRVELNNGAVVRLVVPHVKGGMHVEIRHDGFGNFTFPKCHLERIAVVSANTTEVLVEYQFSKISGGSVLKRTLAGLPQVEEPVPTAIEQSTMQVTVLPEIVSQPSVEVSTAVDADPAEEKSESIIEVTTTVEELKKMTKKQLLSWAVELGFDLVDGHTKAQLLEECIDILEDSN
tara:strand:- start:1397 stop:2074 length:678 start_codon:yes stop_codon:yes gene_type:complete